MKYIISSIDFPNHPNPVDTDIAFILSNNETHISYNSRGQRLGRIRIFDQECIRVYYSKSEIIVFDDEKYCFRFRYDFKSLPKETAYFEIHFMESETHKRSQNFYDDTFFRKHEEIIFKHFDFLIEHWSQLILLDLTSKYNQENFLDIFAVIQSQRLNLTSNRLIIQFYNRLCIEMKSELISGERCTRFLTAGDIVYDELKKVSKL